VSGLIDGCSIYLFNDFPFSIGFGDFHPSNNASKIFSIFYVFFSTLFFAGSMSQFVNIWIDRQAAKRKQELLSLKLSVHNLNDLDADGDGKVSRLEFFHFMLDQLGKVSKEEINEINAKFEELDKDGSGFLDQEDLDKLK
jgi:hypothetical protein